MLEKWISILLILLLFMQTMLPALFGNRFDRTNEDAAANLHSLSDYVDYVDNYGAPAYTTETFVKQAKPFADFLRLLSGRPFPTDENRYLDAQIDETMTALCSEIAAGSSLDLAMLIKSVPNLNAPAELTSKVLHVDGTTLRDYFFAQRDRAYESNNTLLGYILYFLGVYYSVIKGIRIYAMPYEDSEDEIEVIMDIVYGDGEVNVMHPGIIINQTTGEVRGWTDKGLIDLGFNFNTKDLVIYGAVNCWQRALGFSRVYDLLANSTPLFNMSTRRFHFDAHGKEWMIQIWKGNYGLVTNGMEVGVYNREKGSIGTYYNAAADNEMMEMSAALYHKDDLLFQKGPTLHWWLSAFQLSKTIYTPRSLTMTFSITFPDAEMFDAFTAAIDNHGAKDVTYTTDGLTVCATF